jgi:uncharacterized protein YkwD
MILCAPVLLLGVVAASAQDAKPPAPQKTGQPAQTQTANHTDNQASPSATLLELDEKEVDGVKLLAIEANVVAYTNDERARYGLPPLKVDPELMETAREHAAWMTRSQRLVHTMRAVAENIAMGQPDSSDAVRSWMNSPGHRANILNAGHRLIGAAAFRTEGGTIFWCQQFRQ